MLVFALACAIFGARCIYPVDRSKEYIGLNLSVVVWKALVGQEVQLSDLDSVDVLLTRSMNDIRTIDQKGKSSARRSSEWITHQPKQHVRQDVLTGNDGIIPDRQYDIPSAIR